MNRINIFLFYLTNLMLILFRDVDGAPGYFLFFFVISIYIYFFKRNITFSFLLCAVIIADPASMFSGPTFGVDIHFFRLRDVFFYLSFLILFAPQLKEIEYDKLLRKIFPILFIFSFYQIFISLFFKTGISSIFALFKSLEEFKLFIFGIYLLFPAYKIVRSDSKTFFETLAVLSILYSVTYLLSLYTNFKIIEFSTELRRRGSSLIRNFIQNAELFKLMIYFTCSFYLINKDRFEKKYIFSGILTLAIPIIAMFRLEIFYTFMTMLTIYFLIKLTLGIRFAKVFNIGFFSIIGFLLALILFPVFFRNLFETYSLTVQEVFGERAAGTTQTRSIIELPKHLFLIENNPITGVGFRKEWWSNFTNRYDWGLSDIPFTSTLAFYGFFGMILYYTRFIFLFKASGLILSKLKTHKLGVNCNYSLEAIAIYSLVAYFIAMVSFRLFYIGWELTLSRLQIQFGIFIGLFYASIENILNRIDIEGNLTEKSFSVF